MGFSDSGVVCQQHGDGLLSKVGGKRQAGMRNHLVELNGLYYLFVKVPRNIAACISTESIHMLFCSPLTTHFQLQVLHSTSHLFCHS